MEPISHNVLKHMIKHRISQSGLTLKGVCDRAHIDIEELTEVLNGRTMAKSMLLARLAIVFEMDWAHIAIAYSLWRYQMETTKARKIIRNSHPKLDTVFYRISMCDQIIRDNPHLEASDLIEQIYAETLLDRSAIRNQIAHVRGNGQLGEYRYG